MTDEARVVAVTATFRRPAELRRLATHLANLTQPLHAWIIVDNDGGLQLEHLSEVGQLHIVPVRPGKNLGCGGGLRRAEEVGLEQFGAVLTHFWILDDDAAPMPASLEILLRTMREERADAAVPMIVDERHIASWPPGFSSRPHPQLLRHPMTPAEYLERWTVKALPFLWAQGIAMLVTKRALEEAGLHRDDFWIRGEDLDLSLKITHRFRGIFVPEAVVAHLPPAVSMDPAKLRGEYEKHLAMLRNVAFIALRQPHGRRISPTIPGNWWRFLQTWGWKPSVIKDAVRAFWLGAIKGRPAGV